MHADAPQQEAPSLDRRAGFVTDRSRRTASDGARDPSDRPLSRNPPAYRAGHDLISWRIRRDRRPHRRDAARAGDQRRREHALYEQPVDRRRQSHDHGHVPIGTDLNVAQISTSTIISCFVSLTLSPGLCAALFKAHEASDHAHVGPARRCSARLSIVQSRLRVALLRYGSLTRRLVRAGHSVRGLCGAHRHCGRRACKDADRLHPGADQGYLISVVQLPPGATLDRTEKVVRFRRTTQAIARLKARNSSGEMAPIGTVAQLKSETIPYRVPRYNLFPAAEVQGWQRRAWPPARPCIA